MGFVELNLFWSLQGTVSSGTAICDGARWHAALQGLEDTLGLEMSESQLCQLGVGRTCLEVLHLHFLPDKSEGGCIPCTAWCRVEAPEQKHYPPCKAAGV